MLDNRLLGDQDNQSSGLDSVNHLRVLKEAFRTYIFNYRNLSLETFRKLLLVTIFMNVLMLAVEMVHIEYVFEHRDKDGAAFLSLIAVILTLLNIAIISRLYRKPRPLAALVSCAIILFLEVIYIVQTILYYNSLNSTSTLAVIIIFLLAQLISSSLLYRFWEFILFNYDSESEVGTEEQLSVKIGDSASLRLDSPVNLQEASQNREEV